MTYDRKLAGRVRAYLAAFPEFQIKEKQMFRGLAFLVNGKMCVNISGQHLMCRFDPVLTEQLTGKPGFLPVVMKGKELKGYCYVEPAGIKTQKQFQYWLTLCLDFNDQAKASKKTKKAYPK